MQITEEKIWDVITESAKRKFDYAAFRDSLPLDEETNEFISDKIVWSIINGYQVNQSSEQITGRLFNELLISGFKMDKAELGNFIKERAESFKIEIGVADLATNMLNNGEDVLTVYANIIQLLP